MIRYAQQSFFDRLSEQGFCELVMALHQIHYHPSEHTVSSQQATTA